MNLIPQEFEEELRFSDKWFYLGPEEQLESAELFAADYVAAEEEVDDNFTDPDRQFAIVQAFEHIKETARDVSSGINDDDEKQRLPNMLPWAIAIDLWLERAEEAIKEAQAMINKDKFVYADHGFSFKKHPVPRLGEL
jgi:hypothetical protein